VLHQLQFETDEVTGSEVQWAPRCVRFCT